MSLSAESFSASKEGDEVNEWKDISGNGRDVIAASDCGKPVYGKASWNPNIPVVKFGHSGKQSCLKTKSAHPVSTSGTYLAVVSWTGDGGTWEPIATVSHDRYWTVRFFAGTREINMHVRNEQEPRVAVNLGKPYVVVGRVDDANKNSFMWVWDINGNKWVDKQTRKSAGIPGGGNEVITIGRATQKTNEWLHGEIAEYAMWDEFLSDSEVEDLAQQYSKTMRTGGNFLFLSAESLSSANENNEVLEWKDSSGNGRDVIVKDDCGKPYYGKASWNPSIPVVKFGLSGRQSCLKTKSAHPVSISGTYVAVISWTGEGSTWEPIAAVSHDRYWSLRFFFNTREINMHVRNEQEPRVAVDLGKPYVVVGRVDDSSKSSFIWVWDINGNKWVGKQSRKSAGIPGGGNEVITIGRASQIAGEWLHAEIAEYSMWDRFLSDSEVEELAHQYSKRIG